LFNLTASTSMLYTWSYHEVSYEWQLLNNQSDPQFLAKLNDSIQAMVAAIPYQNSSEITPTNPGLWRSYNWSNIVQVFMLDTMTEMTPDQIISPEQMQWLQNGLVTSTSQFKIIVTSVPMSNLTELFGEQALQIGWSAYPVQRTEILQFIENNNIQGLVWVCGELQIGLLIRVGAPGQLGEDQWEVAVGPSGSQINPPMKYYSTQGLSTLQLPIFIDTWTFSSFEADPKNHTILLQFFDDFGVAIDEQVLEFN